jgi:hypothetical protein
MLWIPEHERTRDQELAAQMQAAGIWTDGDQRALCSALRERPILTGCPCGAPEMMARPGPLFRQHATHLADHLREHTTSRTDYADVRPGTIITLPGRSDFDGFFYDARAMEYYMHPVRR